MKIGRGYGEYSDRLVQSKKAQEKYTQTAQTSNAKDNVDLSTTTQKIRETQKSDAVETARADKVAALKQAIKDGSYQVSTEEIAKSMVQSMKTIKDA
ncbi:flagellar biosynthesis anti-sigma factor FlgM [Enterococcus olivae]